eukprot:c11216_g1_i4.p1 GENE.c11216_g1_i4~~c11216_g1_i4.p1  ORF type:complete len:228 (-),score=51.68 c11216_g1_i4:56-706(-)
MARRSCCLVVCVLLVACVQSTPSEGDATSSLQLPVSNDVDGKKELEFCRLCEQFVAGYYAWRFRMPLNTWATATSSLPSPADTARISQEEKHWPMSREVMCGDWGSESSNHLQLQALGLQNASAAQSRRQRCDEFYDSFIDPSDAIQVMDRMHTLVHGCVQDMGDQCPRKWLGTCPPRNSHNQQKKMFLFRCDFSCVIISFISKCLAFKVHTISLF